MHKLLTLFILLFATVHIGFGQSISYQLGLSNIHHHELRITITFSGLEKEQLEIRMPNASPGRYAAHNFAKNVYDEKAFNSSNEAVKITRLTPFSWSIPVDSGAAVFSYILYGNHADGTYMGIDARKLHMNMPATFAYGVGLDDAPIELIIPDQNENWSVASQLSKKNDSTYSAPNYYYFYDSPTMVGQIDWKRWDVDGQTIEIAMMHEGTDSELDAYTEWVKKVVHTQKEIYGELPVFDFGRYTFLVSYNPWVNGDGMEHRNSTVCTSTGNLASNAENLIGTISHEFFHAWNIERIRPKALEPFDFDRVNMSDALWFGEGFTSYFDDLVLTRAGIKDPEQYVKGLIGGLNYVLNSPARTFRGPAQMSQMAPFVDAGTANDETNYSNNFVSYYSYGAVIGLGLDLTLRLEYNKTLDEFMQMVWNQYGEPEIPYTLDDLQQVLAKLTNSKFASTFFEKQIYGSDLPDFKELFEAFGIKMSQQNPNSAYFGNPKVDGNGRIESTITRGTALYDAGVEKGDKIISLDDQVIETTADLNRAINSLQVGQSYTINFEQMGVEKSGNFVAQQDPRVTLSYLSDDKLKKKTVKRRQDWLNIGD
ncbi:MAG: PDZ domain-containing protein [Marinoscillum sp.]